MESNQGDGNKRMYIAIIVLLLLINGVAFYLLYSDTKAKRDLTEQKLALEKDFQKLNDTIAIKETDMEFLMDRNTALNDTILSQKDMLETQKEKINSLLKKEKLTSAELAKAKLLIAEYETSVAGMKKQIEQLLAEKQALTEQNQRLASDLNAERQTTQQLNETNRGLSKRVEIGSLLNLRGFEVVGVKKKSNGKDALVSRIKQVESIRVSFWTGDNKVLEPGEVSLYVRILNPKGETISVADQGSGSIATSGNGETLQYTKKAEIEWLQKDKNVIVYWSQNIKEAGTYKAEVYQSGYLIGSGQVDLK